MHTHDSQPFDVLVHIQEEHPEAPEDFPSLYSAEAWHYSTHEHEQHKRKRRARARRGWSATG